MDGVTDPVPMLLATLPWATKQDWLYAVSNGIIRLPASVMMDTENMKSTFHREAEKSFP